MWTNVVTQMEAVLITVPTLTAIMNVPVLSDISSLTMNRPVQVGNIYVNDFVLKFSYDQ